jgi:TonB family protein
MLLVGLAWMGNFWSSDEHLFDTKDVMMVQAVALPKSNKRMPDRPTRTPDPPKGEVTKTKAPPPPKTASDMALETKKKVAKKQGAANRTNARDDLLNKIRREKLLKDASAAVGKTDRVQTDKDGVKPDEAIIGPSGAGRMDPELARYVAQCRAAIFSNWKPLPAIIAAHPEYKVQLLVTVSASGAIGKPKVSKGSGDTSFDASAISAVSRTVNLPPPPTRYAKSAADGVMITLSAADLR